MIERGFIIHFWDHETRMWETETYDAARLTAYFADCTPETDPDVFDADGNPTPKAFAIGFEDVGNRVKTVTTLDGVIVYDNSEEIERFAAADYFRSVRGDW